MPIDYAEKVARVLLDTQPQHRFPGYHEFGQTADRRLVIRGLGHDPVEIKRFSGRLHRKFEQAMALRRVARRDKRITLALVFVLALLASVEALGRNPIVGHRRLVRSGIAAT